jgi:peptidoglycan/LPS O-acetylase OafA/YrhL
VAERGFGKGRRIGSALIAAGVVVVLLAGYGIVGSGEPRYQLFSAVAALPAGVLLVLMGLDAAERSRSRPLPGRRVVSMEEWLATSQSRRHSARAASN